MTNAPTDAHDTRDEAVKLEPCPFCGGEAKPVKQRWSKRDFHGVSCDGDCLTFFDCRESSEVRAIAAWNRRIPALAPAGPLNTITAWFEGLPRPARVALSCANLHDLSKRLAARPASPVQVGEGPNHDCLAKRRPGEPMFILLGRDPDAHNIVRQWAFRRAAAGGDPVHCQMGLDTAERMRVYAADPANAPASAPPATAYAPIARGVDREGAETALRALKGIPSAHVSEHGVVSYCVSDDVPEAIFVAISHLDAALNQDGEGGK